MPYGQWWVRVLLLLTWNLSTLAVAAELRCGIALGFPPYQYREQHQAQGFDADVARLVMARLGQPCEFVQDEWNQVFNQLRFGKLDLIVGMETNALRQRYFAFTEPYYSRESVIFVGAGSGISALEQLQGLIVSGDRSGLIEQDWLRQGIRQQFRVLELETKAEAMQQLKDGAVQAAIMPLEVGIVLAKSLQVDVRVLAKPRLGSPVAIAVRKGDQELLYQLGLALHQLILEGEIDKLHQRWFSISQTP